MRRRRSALDTAPPGAPLWVLTYSDLITQVLAFFVLLYSFSSLDAQKFQASAASLQEAFKSRTAAPPAEAPPVEGLAAALKEAAERRGFRGVSMAVEPQGLTLRFSDTALFDSGRADLRPEAMAYLDELARLVATAANPLRVEGHTDDIPIATPAFPSNWELSAARAASVVRYLIEEHGLPPERLAIAGYGETRPVASNATPEGRAQNRRVDIVVLRSQN